MFTFNFIAIQMISTSCIINKMSGIFLLASGGFLKKLDLSPLVRLIDETTQKESKIIIKAQASHRPEDAIVEKEEVKHSPTESSSIDYNSLTLSDLSKAFELRGVASMNTIVISLSENGEIEEKPILLDGKCIAQSIKDIAKCENYIIASGSEILGIGTPGILLFDGVIYDAKTSMVLKAADSMADAKSPVALHQLLINTSKKLHKSKDPAKTCAKELRDLILTTIEGDFAFTYIDLLNGFIILGKDRFGKKSLLLHDQSANMGQLCVSSITFGKGNYKEVIGNTLISISFKESSCYIEESPYPASTSRFFPSAPIKDCEALLVGLEKVLVEATEKRVCGKRKTKVAVMFSGGIDSLLLAYLVHKVLPGDEEYIIGNVDRSQG
eukprot:TRINITY_DN1439_c0_g1_i2.p1 TRINITY_DN1439_c0_g1~~TRINITY_DN1439_c0_g1_i2.p1  ORF type:complete len:383 (-),score=40.72 TRINITY_DN1439_c0_g1_i2:1038-2186(-)